MSIVNDNEKSILINLESSIINLENIEQLVDSVSDDVRFVLLGESTHGTHEFYKMRSEMTKLLVKKHNFQTILVEGDWPCFYKINKYMTTEDSSDNTAIESMDGIKKFPLWMWRNSIISELIEWLRDFNLEFNKNKDPIRMLGLDCYSLIQSKKWLIAFLKLVDKDYAKVIKQRLSFLKHYKNENDYGKDVTQGELSQHANYIQQLFQKILSEIQWDKMDTYLKRCDELDIDKFAAISAEQCCEVIVNADEYYRKLYLEPPGSNASWNTRDQHMTMTIMRLQEQLQKISKTKKEQKIIVWAHNSHVKDAMATSGGSQSFDENNAWNLGQMVRSMFGKDKVKIFGFHTYTGTVTASSKWNQPCKKFELKKAIDESCENFFHKVAVLNNMKQFFINTNKIEGNFLTTPRIQRYIGVNYRPDNELRSHYEKGKIGEQYDVIVFVDETTALKELDTGIWKR